MMFCETKKEAYCLKKIEKPKPELKNCSIWYDGCNTCSFNDGKLGDCTEIACFGTPGKAHCKKRIDEDDVPKKNNYTGCKVWFDGCNNWDIKYGKIDSERPPYKKCRFSSPPKQYCQVFDSKYSITSLDYDKKKTMKVETKTKKAAEDQAHLFTLGVASVFAASLSTV
jgi:hypothetical protein